MIVSPISGYQLAEAKEKLRLGWSLQAVAEWIYATARDLDIALWRALGRRS